MSFFNEFAFKPNVSLRKKVLAHINKKIDDAEKEAEAEIVALHTEYKNKIQVLNEGLQTDSQNVIDRKVNEVLNLWPRKE